MAADIVAGIRCPICGNERATVHEQVRGGKKGARYIRCYASPGSLSMRCGTLQCVGPSGQAYIETHQRPFVAEAPAPAPAPIAPKPELEPSPEPLKAAPAPIAKPLSNGGGLLSSLARMLGDED